MPVHVTRTNSVGGGVGRIGRRNGDGVSNGGVGNGDGSGGGLRVAAAGGAPQRAATAAEAGRLPLEAAA